MESSATFSQRELSSRSSRLDQFIAARRLPWFAAFVGMALCATAVGRHLVLDDYVLALAARNAPRFQGMAQGGFDLFTFTTGRVQDNADLMAKGVLLPWWTQPNLKIAFFRPLSSATHHLDFALWPDSPEVMYLHSLLWLGAAIVAVATVFRRIEGVSVVAGLATLLYAVDDTRAPVVSWISNRNALIATMFGALSLAAHIRARREGNAWSTFVAPALLLLGLLSGELALGAIAYLVAYAVTVDPAPVRSRLLSLAPYAVVFIAWRAFYSFAGFGARGSGAYLDPTADPLDFAVDLPKRLLVLLGGQFGMPPSDLAFLGPPEQLPFFLAIAGLTALIVAYLTAPILRAEKLARFWALGALLAAVPISASFSSDRLLPMVGIGASALVARVAVSLFSAVRAKLWELRTFVAGGFFALHAVVAPLVAPVRAAQMQMLGRVSDSASRALDEIAGIEDKTVLILNAPVTLFATYLQAQRASRNQPLPAHVYLLATAGSPLEVEGRGELELSVRPASGFLHTPLDRHYRAQMQGLEKGTRLHLAGLGIEVVEVTADGRPAEVRFKLDRAEADRYELMVWKNDRYVAINYPEAGEVLRLPALDFGLILLQSVMGSP